MWRQRERLETYYYKAKDINDCQHSVEKRVMMCNKFSLRASRKN
jgi:hypothetical protein